MSDFASIVFNWFLGYLLSGVEESYCCDMIVSYRKSLISDCKPSGRSLMYMRNNIGSLTYPCGYFMHHSLLSIVFIAIQTNLCAVTFHCDIHLPSRQTFSSLKHQVMFNIKEVMAIFMILTLFNDSIHLSLNESLRVTTPVIKMYLSQFW